MSDIADDLREVYEGKSGDENTIEKDTTGAPLVREAESKPNTTPIRDDGRFGPKTAAENTVPENSEPKPKEVAPAEGVSEGQAPATTQQPAQPASRAPVSWKPEVREEWAKLPPAVQAEVMRRESEVQSGLRQASQARQFYQQFEQTIAPYEAILRAENAHPLAAMSELFKTAAALRTSPAPQRAQLVADMIMQFGVDVNLLDEALTTKLTGKQQPQFDASAIDAKLAPVIDFVNQLKARPEQQYRQEALQSWEQFTSDPANEFAEDVREDIADLLDLAAKRGQILSLQDAYKRATMAHPTIAGLVQQRQQVSAAAQQTAAARRAKEAAASIPSGGAPSRDEAADDGSIRSAITAAVSSLSRAK